MIHSTRTSLDAITYRDNAGAVVTESPPVGQTRTLIFNVPLLDRDGVLTPQTLFVDWSGTLPTPQAVADHLQPTDQQLSLPRRAAAKLLLTGDRTELGKLLRAIADAARDSDNALRAWDMQMKTVVAAAPATILGIRAAIAGLPAMPPLTTAQVLSAIAARIDDGTVD